MGKRRVWYPRCSYTSKIRYPTEAIAYECMLKFMAKGKPDPGIHTYYCKRCYGWHLGSSTRSLARVMGDTGDKQFKTD